jgi:hypothetical protein
VVTRAGRGGVIAGAALLAAACAPAAPRADGSAQALLSARQFALEVAAGVSRDGPSAWHRYFADTPEFFMVVNGQLAFADGAAAAKGIDALPQLIQHIELKWGDDLRVDALSADFAVVAASYHEVLTDPKGERTASNGYFTAVAERHDGRWRFRDAHWSAR